MLVLFLKFYFNMYMVTLFYFVWSAIASQLIHSSGMCTEYAIGQKRSIEQPMTNLFDAFAGFLYTCSSQKLIKVNKCALSLSKVDCIYIVCIAGT